MALTVREEYIAALKEGQKECARLTALGKDPYPAVLEELLPEMGRLTVQELPSQEIPLDRIAGTRTRGRTSALTAGFLPLLPEESEFAQKWMALCEANLSDTGIRDPISCFEYLGAFYVQEGNKRVSVMRHFGTARIMSNIRRVLPPRSEDPRIRAYYEFVDFHKCSGSYEIQFLKPGEYSKLLTALDKKPGEVWPEEERRRFSARYHYFKEAFSALGGRQKALRPEDGLLLWLQVYGYDQLGAMTAKELKDSLSSLWEDVQVTGAEDAIAVRTEPEEEPSKSLLEKLISPAPKRLKVAMIYQQDEKISTWTRGHDQGAAYLSGALPEQVTVQGYYHADTAEEAEAILDQAAAEGADLVFTTTPLLLKSTLKAAVKYPKIHFLNCSAGNALSSVRSYYCRIYEGKFITGMIAGAMAKNDTIGYVASYPILGVPASINAFSLGARMTNPRARILLEWSCTEGNAVQKLIDRGALVISNRDVPVPNAHYMGMGEYGTYLIDAAGRLNPLASPCWMWGKLYENVARAVLSGSWNGKKEAPEAINYWWGMDSGVIDVEMTELVPEGIRTLASSVMEQIKAGSLLPFKRALTDQAGAVRNDGSRDLSSREILTMDYLSDAVEGSIPAYEELLPMSRALVRELGLHPENLPLEG